MVLQFLDVDSIQLSNGILSVDEPYVDDLGYKEPSDTDYDSVMLERDALPAAHFFLRVGGDEFVRVQARRAKAILSAE